MFTVAIVGMPNVGKSTLFNALIGKKFAIIHNSAGITRDYKVAECNFIDLKFQLIDTAGWEVNDKDLSPLMKEQTKTAISKANVVLLMLDATRNITGYEVELVKYIRRHLNNNLNKCIVVINKSDSRNTLDINEIYRLGINEYINISAINKLGFNELYHLLKLRFKELESEHESLETAPENSDSTVGIAIVGRPNAGKSTIFNGILQEKRAIVSEVSGTTRDSISHRLSYKDSVLEFIDTAGLRKRKKIKSEIENFSASGSITSIRRANVIVLVLDATVGIDSQEVKIAGIAQNEGKPLIVVLNKVDLLTSRRTRIKELIDEIRHEISDSKDFCILYKSALRDKNYEDLLTKILSLHEKWQSHIKTSKLNNWIIGAQEEHMPPLASSGRRIKLKYITQCAVKPPSFKVFCNYPKQLPGSYVRYLRSNFIKEFNLQGVPIRFEITKSKNPYEK